MSDPTRQSDLQRIKRFAENNAAELRKTGDTPESFLQSLQRASPTDRKAILKDFAAADDQTVEPDPFDYDAEQHQLADAQRAIETFANANADTIRRLGFQLDEFVEVLYAAAAEKRRLQIRNNPPKTPKSKI